METLTKVTKDMVISDVVRNYPQSVDIMLRHGLHCFGCGVSLYETIEQGALGHGMPEEQLDALVEDLNHLAENHPEKTEDRSFIVTERAALKAKEFMQKDGKEGWGLRVGVVPGGCSGLTYLMDFEQEKAEDDMVFEAQGVKFFVNSMDLEHLGGSTLDYIETLQGSGFKISNPNVRSTCGCGKSFR